jgi:hypothetical protein
VEIAQLAGGPCAPAITKWIFSAKRRCARRLARELKEPLVRQLMQTDWLLEALVYAFRDPLRETPETIVSYANETVHDLCHRFLGDYRAMTEATRQQVRDLCAPLLAILPLTVRDARPVEDPFPPVLDRIVCDTHLDDYPQSHFSTATVHAWSSAVGRRLRATS